jgi:GxxExxY protein
MGEIAKSAPSLSRKVIGAAIDVHRKLGPGLLESAYKPPLVWALQERKLRVVCEKPFSLEYGGNEVPRAYFIDFVVEERLIIEAKAIEQILPVHIAQVQTYLKLSGYRLGLLINFNVRILKGGIRRIFHPDDRRTPQRPRREFFDRSSTLRPFESLATVASTRPARPRGPGRGAR